MRKALVAAIVGVGLLAGCATPEIQAQRTENKNAFSNFIMNNGEIISSVSAREGYAVNHTVRYNGRLYQCLVASYGKNCTRV